MPYDEKLAERVRDSIGPRRGRDEIKMFGGVCFTLNGNMCCGVLRDELLLRVPSDQFDSLMRRPGAHPMDMMKSGRAPTGFLMVSSSATASKKQLDAWVKIGVDYAAALPPKAAKPKKRAAKSSANKTARR